MSYYRNRIANQAAKYRAPTAAELKVEQKRRADRENLRFIESHPQIGMLVRRSELVFYVTSPAYRESADPRELISEVVA